jgi:hypothetical protein
MLIASIQAVLTAIACALLFAGWRWFRRDRTIALLVAGGLLIRAIAGQVLFWISYLHLPIAESLQRGQGFWFYATDGFGYFRVAINAADRGILAVFSYDRAVMSPGFTQVLAVFSLLFGGPASMALLLNLAAYLGTCAIVVKLAGPQKRVAMLAIAAISFSPAFVLWSTQPLKDVFFVFLFAAFVGVVASWIAVWNRKDHTLPRALLITLAMLAVVGVLAGIRWYYALALLVISAPLLIVTALRTARPLRAVVVLLCAYGAVFAGALYVAMPHLPVPVRLFIQSPDLGEAMRAPQTLASVLDGARSSYDLKGGATRIDAGTLLGGSRVARFTSGSAALLLPRPVARATGLAVMHGGRGFWWFADVDTLFFDVFLIVAVVALLRARDPGKWRNPLLWLVVLVTVAIGAMFVYCVANFGALFRYRSMLFIGVILVPVVMAWAASRGDNDAVQNV